MQISFVHEMKDFDNDNKIYIFKIHLSYTFVYEIRSFIRNVTRMHRNTFTIYLCKNYASILPCSKQNVIKNGQIWLCPWSKK